MLHRGMVIEGVEFEELERVIVGNDKEKFFQVGVQLPPRKKEKLIVFLWENIDVFAWDAYEAPRVDPNFICHYLNVNLSVIPKKQPLRRSSEDHSDAVKEEAVKLKRAGAIKEVFYPDWLANTVVVKKKKGSGEYAYTSQIFIKLAKRTPFPCLG